MIKTMKIIALGVLILVVISSCFTTIETGERGVILRMGKYIGNIDEGLSFKVPFLDNIVKMDIRDHNFPLRTEVSSKDMQTIQVEVSLIYALNPSTVGNIYQTFGTKYEDIFIKPTLSEIVNSIIAEYPIEIFVEKRSEISNRINQAFVAKADGNGLVVKSLLLTNHDFSDEYNKAIENKKVAEQGALKAKYDLERIKLEAEAQRQKQNSLSDMVLLEMAITKWDGKLPTYYVGKDGQVPFILNK